MPPETVISIDLKKEKLAITAAGTPPIPNFIALNIKILSILRTSANMFKFSLQKLSLPHLQGLERYMNGLLALRQLHHTKL